MAHKTLYNTFYRLRHTLMFLDIFNCDPLCPDCQSESTIGINFHIRPEDNEMQGEECRACVIVRIGRLIHFPQCTPPAFLPAFCFAKPSGSATVVPSITFNMKPHNSSVDRIGSGDQNVRCTLSSASAAGVQHIGVGCIFLATSHRPGAQHS